MEICEIGYHNSAEKVADDFVQLIKQNTFFIL